MHDSHEVKQKDFDRTLFLNQNRISVLRFRNEDVEQDIETVLEKIKADINEKSRDNHMFRPPTP